MLPLSYARGVRRAHGFGKAENFLVQAFMHRRIAARWLNFLDSALSSSAPDDIKIHLAQKIFRPYLRRWIMPSERVDLVMFHYEVLVRNLSHPALISLFQHPGI